MRVTGQTRGRARGGGGPAPPGPTSHAREHPKAKLAFGLALGGLLLFWPAGVLGLVFGHEAKGARAAAPQQYSNSGLVTAALVLGWICLALVTLVVLFSSVAFWIGFAEGVLEGVPEGW